MLLENIRKDMVLAKKEKNTLKANLLSALFAETYILAKSGKEVSDEDSLKVIKKFIKNIDETLALDIREDSRKKYQSERVILESYLPKQLSAEEIDKTVSELLSQGKQMKDIMIHFKENFPGQYDGRTVSDAVKRKQSG